MVDFEVGPAIAAGLLGGAVMLAMLYAAIAMMPQLMRMNLLLLLGTMAGMRGTQAYMAGLVVHFVNSAIFGIIHGAVFATGDIEDVVLLWGVLFGLIHAVASGMGLAMMPLLHPEIRAGRMEAPGFLAISLGRPTAVGFVMLHVVFGAVVAVSYAAWI